MSIELKDIFVGNANGNDEAHNENFSNLYFNENNNYEQILNNNLKFIISGQKGTGKTILAKFIELNNTNKTQTTKVLTKEIFTFQKLIELGNSELEKDEQAPFLTWAIIIQISNCILEKKVSFSNINNSNLLKKMYSYFKYKYYYKKLKKFLNIRYPKGNYQSKNYSLQECLLSEAQIENTIKTFKKLIKASASSTTKKDYQQKNYYSVLSELKDLVFKLLNFISIILIFDDLDELELKLDNENTDISLLLNLIYSVKTINSEMQEKGLNKSKCILLMRSDILSQLNKFTSNLNKSLDDGVITLYWIDKYYNNPYEHPLMKMILNKIRVSCQQFSSLSDATLYSNLFPSQVDNKDVVRYLIDYSFGRPRDIIRYLNIIIENNSNSTTFTSQMFANCKKDYSDKFCDELFNELHIHTSHKYTEELLSLLKDFNRKSFNLSQIEKFYNDNKNSYPTIINIRNAIKDLYRFGIIGNTWRKSNKPLYSWAYRKDGNKEVDYTKRFTVHYGFRKHLFLE